MSRLLAQFEGIVHPIDESFGTVLAFFVIKTVFEGFVFFDWDHDRIFDLFWFSVQAVLVFPPDLQVVVSYFLCDFFGDAQIVGSFESAFGLCCYLILVSFQLIFRIDEGLADRSKDYQCILDIVSLFFGLCRFGNYFDFIEIPAWLNFLSNELTLLICSQFDICLLYN